MILSAIHNGNLFDDIDHDVVYDMILSAIHNGVATGASGECVVYDMILSAIHNGTQVIPYSIKLYMI